MSESVAIGAARALGVAAWTLVALEDAHIGELLAAGADAHREVGRDTEHTIVTGTNHLLVPGRALLAGVGVTLGTHRALAVALPVRDHASDQSTAHFALVNHAEFALGTVLTLLVEVLKSYDAFPVMPVSLVVDSDVSSNTILGTFCSVFIGAIAFAMCAGLFADFSDIRFVAFASSFHLLTVALGLVVVTDSLLAGNETLPLTSEALAIGLSCVILNSSHSEAVWSVLLVGSQAMTLLRGTNLHGSTLLHACFPR